MGRYIRGNIDEEVVLSTLAARTLIAEIFDETVIERTLVASIESTYALKDIVVAVDDGPITVGVAHSDYTDAEIEAVIENTGSWNEGNKVQQEVSKRLVRVIGTFPITQAATEGAQTFVLNEGMKIKTKLNWILTTGQSLRLFVYNGGSSALTGSASVFMYGHANLFPR